MNNFQQKSPCRCIEEFPSSRQHEIGMVSSTGAIVVHCFVSSTGANWRFCCFLCVVCCFFCLLCIVCCCASAFRTLLLLLFVVCFVILFLLVVNLTLSKIIKPSHDPHALIIEFRSRPCLRGPIGCACCASG